MEDAANQLMTLLTRGAEPYLLVESNGKGSIREHVAYIEDQPASVYD